MGRPPDGRLINGDHLVHLVKPLDPLMLSGDRPRPVQVARKPFVKDFIYK